MSNTSTSTTKINQKEWTKNSQNNFEDWANYDTLPEVFKRYIKKEPGFMTGDEEEKMLAEFTLGKAYMYGVEVNTFLKENYGVDALRVWRRPKPEPLAQKTAAVAENNNKLSRSGQDNLNIVKEWAESGSKFMNLEDGEVRILSFNPEQIEIVDKQGFDGKPVKKARYTVVDPNRSEEGEKWFEGGKRVASRISKLMNEGHFVLKVERQGLKTDTVYVITAAD